MLCDIYTAGEQAFQHACCNYRHMTHQSATLAFTILFHSHTPACLVPVAAKAAVGHVLAQEQEVWQEIPCRDFCYRCEFPLSR